MKYNIQITIVCILVCAGLMAIGFIAPLFTCVNGEMVEPTRDWWRLPGLISSGCIIIVICVWIYFFIERKLED